MADPIDALMRSLGLSLDSVVGNMAGQSSNALGYSIPGTSKRQASQGIGGVTGAMDNSLASVLANLNGANLSGALGYSIPGTSKGQASVGGVVGSMDNALASMMGNLGGQNLSLGGYSIPGYSKGQASMGSLAALQKAIAAQQKAEEKARIEATKKAAAAAAAQAKAKAAAAAKARLMQAPGMLSQANPDVAEIGVRPTFGDGGD